MCLKRPMFLYSECMTLFFCTQGQWLHVPVYISGFVIGTAPLCVAVTSPLLGYFVRTHFSMQ